MKFTIWYKISELTAYSEKSVLWRQPHLFIMELLMLPFLRPNFAICFEVLLSIMNYFNVGAHTINLAKKKAEKYDLFHIAYLVLT